LLQLITSEGNRARELTERKTNKGTKRREKKCVFVSCFVHSSLPLQTNTHLFHFVLRSFSYTTRIISEWNERKRTEKNEMNVMEWKGSTVHFVPFLFTSHTLIFLSCLSSFLASVHTTLKKKKEMKRVVRSTSITPNPVLQVLLCCVLFNVKKHASPYLLSLNKAQHSLGNS